MDEHMVIRLRDLRRYLERFSDDAVVLRDIADARVDGAYVDLNVAMRHLEQEHGLRGDEDDAEDEDLDAALGMDEEEDDDEARLEEQRALARDQERSIVAWENTQN